MIDHLQSTVVPDAALESLAAEGRLILAAMRHAKKSLLPAIKLNWGGFGAPRSMCVVGLGAIVDRETRVFHGVTAKHAIVVSREIIVSIIDRCRVVHIWIKQVIQVNWRLVSREVRQESLVVNRDWVQKLAEE